jgi:hypothetical protein
MVAMGIMGITTTIAIDFCNLLSVFGRTRVVVRRRWGHRGTADLQGAAHRGIDDARILEDPDTVRLGDGRNERDGRQAVDRATTIIIESIGSTTCGIRDGQRGVHHCCTATEGDGVHVACAHVHGGEVVRAQVHGEQGRACGTHLVQLSGLVGEGHVLWWLWPGPRWHGQLVGHRSAAARCRIAQCQRRAGHGRYRGAAWDVGSSDHSTYRYGGNGYTHGDHVGPTYRGAGDGRGHRGRYHGKIPGPVGHRGLSGERGGTLGSSPVPERDQSQRGKKERVACFHGSVHSLVRCTGAAMGASG